MIYNDHHESSYINLIAARCHHIYGTVDTVKNLMMNIGPGDQVMGGLSDGTKPLPGNMLP